MLKNRLSITLLGLVALVTALSAQAPSAVTPVFTANSRGTGPLDRLAFRQIGPGAPSGRIDDLAVLESDPSTFYVATATGGVHKTTNNGTTFTPVFDHEGSSSVGDIAIAPTDANLVWVGTGENNNRQSSSWGDGIYKSTDGGRSWKNMGLRASKQIARVIVDPVDFNVVHVAALGDLWATGGERGVYKTSDGGLNWKRTLHVDDDTGATELVMDPANNKVLYAATYQRRRAQWGMNGGGAGSGIWKSMDAGETWTKIENGIPAGPEGTHRHGHLSGQSQRALRPGRAPDRERRLPHRRRRRHLAQAEQRQPAADVLQPDPRRSADRLAHLRASACSSTSPTTAAAPSATTAPRASTSTHHAMWINPANPRHIILGNDGGVASPTIARRPGYSCPTWCWPRPITWPTTCSRRITSAPACRTTTPGAARARCAPTRASPTTTGTSSRAATASSR